MSDKKAVAKKALRSLHNVLTKSLDSNLADGFFAESLLTENELQDISAEKTDYRKNNKLLESLRKRGDEAKVMDALVRLLEGEDGEDKETNAVILKRIEKEYHFYSYDAQSDGPPEAPSQIPRGTSIGAKIEIPPLPRLDPGDHTDNGKSAPLRDLQVVEAVDGGGRSSGKDAYPITSMPRGICVIINNENFQNMKARAGSAWDANALEKLFGSHLGFHIERFDNIDSKQIKQLLENIRVYDHSKLSCLVVCILSHGIDGQIYGVDGELVPVAKITRTFVGTKCPSLAGKPKVFLLQACRGGLFDHGVKIEQTDNATGEEIDEKKVLGEDETDGGGYEMALPDESDFLIAYATTPGFVSWRNSAFGTWFIKSFTETMYKQAADDHLMDILTEVNRLVAEEYQSREFKKQMPAPVTMLRYKLFLPPV